MVWMCCRITTRALDGVNSHGFFSFENWCVSLWIFKDGRLVCRVSLAYLKLFWCMQFLHIFFSILNLYQPISPHNFPNILHAFPMDLLNNLFAHETMPKTVETYGFPAEKYQNCLEHKPLSRYLYWPKVKGYFH